MLELCSHVSNMEGLLADSHNNQIWADVVAPLWMSGLANRWWICVGLRSHVQITMVAFICNKEHYISLCANCLKCYNKLSMYKYANFFFENWLLNVFQHNIAVSFCFFCFCFLSYCLGDWVSLIPVVCPRMTHKSRKNQLELKPAWGQPSSFTPGFWLRSDVERWYGDFVLVFLGLDVQGLSP